MSEQIQVYVADLAAYNNGILHGVWVDATQSVEDIYEQINNMLAASPIEAAEEYAIHDYDGFGSYQISEYETIQSVHEVANFIEEYDTLGAELLDYFSSVDEAKKMMEENYAGCYESLSDYAQELTEGSTTIPESLAYYIDDEKMGRDMELSGDVFTIEIGYQEVYIFWNR